MNDFPENAQDVERFIAGLGSVPWFSNIGKPTPPDAGVERIYLRVIGCSRSARSDAMARKAKDVQELKIQRPKRVKLSEEETLKRLEAFDQRREQFVASVRKGKS